VGERGATSSNDGIVMLLYSPSSVSSVSLISPLSVVVAVVVVVPVWSGGGDQNLSGIDNDDDTEEDVIPSRPLLLPVVVAEKELEAAESVHVNKLDDDDDDTSSVTGGTISFATG